MCISLHGSFTATSVLSAQGCPVPSAALSAYFAVENFPNDFVTDTSTLVQFINDLEPMDCLFLVSAPRFNMFPFAETFAWTPILHMTLLSSFGLSFVIRKTVCWLQFN